MWSGCVCGVGVCVECVCVCVCVVRVVYNIKSYYSVFLFVGV